MAKPLYKNISYSKVKIFLKFNFWNDKASNLLLTTSFSQAEYSFLYEVVRDHVHNVADN